MKITIDASALKSLQAQLEDESQADQLMNPLRSHRMNATHAQTLPQD